MADALTIQGIWAGMKDDLAVTVLGETKREAPDIYREALATAAVAVRMRPQALQQQPAARQAATIRRVLTQVGRDDLGARLLTEWLTKRHKPMLTAFLDDLGISHDDGVIRETLGPEPAAEKLSAAIGRLRDAYPPAHVRIYLQAFAVTTANAWTGLPALIDV